MDVFRNLSSTDARIRAAATLTLVKELQEVQKFYEQSGTKGNDDGDLKLEAAKDAPTMRYAIRWLIHGISSSRAVSFLSSKLSKEVLIPGNSSLNINWKCRAVALQC